jgi:hypothetical protein
MWEVDNKVHSEEILKEGAINEEDLFATATELVIEECHLLGCYAVWLL